MSEHTPSRALRPRASRRLDRPRWLGGAVVVALGLLLLLDRTGTWTFRGPTWGALLLVPVAALGVAAARTWRANGGHVDRDVRGLLAAAVVPLTLGLMILTRTDWSTTWPVLVIAAGAAALLRH